MLCYDLGPGVLDGGLGCPGGEGEGTTVGGCGSPSKGVSYTRQGGAGEILPARWRSVLQCHSLVFTLVRLWPFSRGAIPFRQQGPQAAPSGRRTVCCIQSLVSHVLVEDGVFTLVSSEVGGRMRVLGFPCCYVAWKT
jgi:hypothetical protein